MYAFQVKAPGKVILHGEHSVVYGKPALAAVVGLSTILKFQPLAEKQEIVLRLETLNCIYNISLEEFNGFLQSFRSKHPVVSLDDTSALLLQVKEAIEQSNSLPNKKIQSQKAYTAFYYVLAGACLSSPQEHFLLKKGFEISIESDLTLGAGLGSSASFGAVIAAASLLISGHFDENCYESAENLEIISQWAYESERLMHGTPSGVDNIVCTHGGMIKFTKGQGFIPLTIQRPLNILLVDSRISRSTADVVANVRHLRETFTPVIDSIWQAIHELVEQAIPLYQTFGNSQDDSEKFEKMERLFQINNDLLKAIGVTHPKLEQIFTIAFKRGFFSKITGAGCGGFALVLLPENYQSNEVYWKLKEELEAAGFGVQATTVGGTGLKIQKV